MTPAETTETPNSTIAQFGHFDEDQGCFIMTQEPPRKWWNLHCSKINPDGIEMYAECAHINDGQTWLRDAAGNTTYLCSYDNKYHYIRDDKTNITFCVSGIPEPTEVAKRTVEFHREKTVMHSQCIGLNSTQRVFVPRHYPVECTTITLQNTTQEEREISVFSYVKFHLGGWDANGNIVYSEMFSEVRPDINGVFVTNRNTDVPTARYKGYLVTLNQFHNANGYRDHLSRADYQMSATKLGWGWNCDGRDGYGPDCAGVVQVKLKIPPFGTARADFILGHASNPEEVVKIQKTLSPELIDMWCDEARTEFKDRAESFKIDVGHQLYNGLFNIFLKKQFDHYLINKSGFRDNLQTDMALVIADQPAVEANLLRALSSQYANGSVPHGFRPLNRLNYSDKPAWLLQALPEVIKETGDYNFLEREVPYLDSTERGTVWNHAVRALRWLASDTGKHGLCDQHHADWNDGLEATREAGARESVFVSMQLCLGAREIAELAQRIGDKTVQQEAESIYQTFKDRINEVAWDGEWYVRTLCEDGYRIGSKSCKEGRIYLNPQSWAVLSGVAEGDRALAIMQKVDEILEEDIGYRICYPPYAHYDPRVGRMSNSMPGASENGGCYNHAAGFKGVADCHIGRADQAWRTFTKVTPDSPDNPIINSGAEPFSYTNSYSTASQIYGAAGYAWRTGTAAWFGRLLVEYILGARRSYEGLIIDPCLPASLPQASLTRKFRGATYHIQLKNRPEGGKGAKKITVDGQQITGSKLPVATGGEYHVKVEL